MKISEIQKGSIQVVKRDGNRLKLQCLKEDIKQLPLKGIASGSTCLVLDASENEYSVYVFNQPKFDENGVWYGV